MYQPKTQTLHHRALDARDETKMTFDKAQAHFCKHTSLLCYPVTESEYETSMSKPVLVRQKCLFFKFSVETVITQQHTQMNFTSAYS